MATTYAMAAASSRQALAIRLRDYYSLTKPEVNLLILITTSAGFYLASRGALNVFGLLNTLVGTLLVASGTATLNQYLERAHDAAMRRTANRPVASSRLAAREALFFGLALSLAGGLFLWLAVNPLSSLLAISTLLSYLLVYTPLKRVTPLCTLLGSFPGAMPTLIGWAGASAGLNRQAWLLFSLLFLWQFPHFLAIALMYREDYERAGYRMLPAFDREGRFTRAEIVGFTLALALLTLLPVSPHRLSLLYPLGMGSAGAFFLFYSVRLARSATRVAASHLLHASVIYLPVVLLIMAVFKS
jgi:heme o synthase